MAATSIDLQALQTTYPQLTTLQDKLSSLQHLYTKIRDVKTTHVDYARYCKRIMTLICEEGLASRATLPKSITTPTGSVVEGVQLDENRGIVGVSIIRAGDSMLDTFLNIVPEASVGKILIQRNEETHEPEYYYCKCPNLTGKLVFLLDPMLATGGSVVVAIRELINRGAKEEDIVFLNVVSCPEGIEKLTKIYPAVQIVTGWVDNGLNEKKYIVPGLGDYGDRFFNT